MENNNLLKIFRQKFLRNAKHAISARGSSVDQQNALAPIRRVGSCKEGVNNKITKLPHIYAMSKFESVFPNILIMNHF